MSRNAFREDTPVPDESDFPLYEEPGQFESTLPEVDYTIQDKWLASETDLMIPDWEPSVKPDLSNKAFLDATMPDRTTRMLDDAPVNMLEELLSVRNSSISENLPTLKAWIDGDMHYCENKKDRKRVYLYDPAFTAADLREGLIYARNALREARSKVREIIALADKIEYQTEAFARARVLFAPGKEVKLELAGIPMKALNHDELIRDHPIYDIPDIRVVISEICNHMAKAKIENNILRRQLLPNSTNPNPK